MASHVLILSKEFRTHHNSSRLRQFAALILVAAIATSTFAPTGIPQRVRESRRISRGVAPRDPQVTSRARSSLPTVTTEGRDRQKHHGEPASPIAESFTCDVYPIALSSSSLAHVAAGEVITDIYNGAQPGNFGWLSWTGGVSEPALFASLTPPGDSNSYVNPNNPSDHEVSVGDWVRGRPGVSNGENVRDALDALKSLDIIVPVWNQAEGQGSNALYRVAAFAQVRLLAYELPGQNRISARFIGYTECPIPVNEAPQVNAGTDQTITLPANGALNGAVTDDGLPRGGTVTVLWTKVSGPGNVTFGNPSSLNTTATFSSNGTYLLRLTASDTQLSSSDELSITVLSSNQSPAVNAGPDQSVVLPGRAPRTLTLHALSTGFNNPIGIDYHEPTNKIVMSVNYSSGQPYNFELVAADGTRMPFSNVRGYTDELKIATARDDAGNGMSIGGFRAGELFTGSGVPGVIVRISRDGSFVQNPWVILPGETGVMRGSLYVDKTGIFGGDLIAVTTTGGVWRINSAGQPTQLTRLGTHLEGLSTIPNDPSKYGPWAGKILAGAEDQGLLYTVDAQGHIAFYQLGINPEDIDIIPANENFFGVGFGEQTLWGASPDGFSGMVGDILVAQESPGILYRVHWNGTAFEKTQLAQVSQWEHVTFAPAGISEIPPVGLTVNLNGSVTDDNAQGFPLSVAWTKVSGPSPVYFADPNQAITTATIIQPGTYVLRLTANDTEFIVSDELTIITVNPGNQAPTVDAGRDQTVTLPNTATLSGSANDDGLPEGSVLISSWEKISGTGNVSFANATAPTTTASFSLPGVYILRLTANDSLLSSNDDVVVTVNQTNQAPVVSAGPDQTITLPDMVSLNGTATDDGLPAGASLTTLWTKVSGPGNVTFASATSVTTTAAFGAPGTYVLRLTASDSVLTNSDDLTVTVKPKPFSSRVYTLNADFDEGSAINVVQSVPNQLQLDDTAHAFSFIWVAVSTKGTIAKINTETGAVLGEYRTAPEGQGTDPSRTTVDHNGSVWTANRADSSVVRVGLLENGQCVDRNGNGVIETSHALGDIRPWPNADGRDTDGGVETAVDECIINYVRVNSSGTRHVSVNADNDVWVSGTGTQVFNLIDGKTGLIKRTEGPVGYGGYGGLIDRFGVIWSARPLLRWDTSGPLSSFIHGSWSGYGHDSYGLCIDSQSNVWNTSLEGNTIRKFHPDGAIIGSFQHGSYSAQGCVVDRNDDVWVAHSIVGANNTVGHLKSDGTFVGNVTVGSGPTGVAVDASGKIWSTNYYDRTVSRIDPIAGPIGADGVTRVGAVDFTTVDLGGNLYNYSDMTGSTLTGAPNTGTWSAVFDSGIVGAEWGRIGWTARVCSDASLTVSVASSEDGSTFGPAEIVTSGADPNVTNGRYLKIIVSFQRAATGESPVLYDLSVGTQGFTLPVSANTAPEVNAGLDQTIVQPNVATLHGIACDDTLPTGSHLTTSWQKISGAGTVTFGNANSLNTTATFSVADTYVLRLTASDTQLSGSDDVTINVLTNQPPNVDAGLRQTIKLPEAVNLDGTVSDDGIPLGGALTVTWSKVSGPGTVNFGNANSADTTATFSSIGYYVLRLTANDSLLSSHGDVTIKVLSAEATLPGGVFVTGHDPDFHAAYNGPGASLNPTGAKHIIQRAVAYVTLNKPNTRLLLVTDVRDPGSSEFLDSRLGLRAAGFTFDIADYGSGQQGALDLHTVNFSSYDVIVIASDFGGWLRQDELDILNARRSEIIDYVNNGGGLVALAESGSHGSLTTHDRFGFLPFLVNQAAIEHEEVGNTVTAAGLALGLTNDDVNGNAFHNFFTSTGGMDIVDVDPENRILSLALRGQTVTTGGFANDAPIVSAGPDQTINLPNAVTLNGIVSDDGQPLGSTLTVQWSKVSGPGSVTFSNPNHSTSTATFSVSGTYVLRLTATDSQLTSSDDVIINVLTNNQAPIVSAGQDQIVAFGNAANLRGSATDDGLPVGATLTISWTKVSGPGTVGFNNASQFATTAAFSLGGRYVLRLSVSDSQLTTSDDVNITVNQAPVVNAGPDQTITLPNTATLNYTVSDDGLPIGDTTVTWSKVSGPGSVTFQSAGNSTVTASFSEAGIYVLRLSADDSHLTTADEVTVTVNSGAPPPLVSIISPADESTLTTRTNVIGSVSDGTWKLEYSPTADEGAPTQWITFATGVGAVSNAGLGIFDPTLLLNGRYLIRLSATRGGQTASAEVGVVVSEEQKIGNFTVSFTDLSVPVAGLPIEVTRTYDSRDKRQGDFGVGWTLGVRNVRLQESRAAGAQWQGDVSGGQFPTYCINPSKPHVVTVTLANGRVYKFEAVLSPGNGCQALAPLQEVTLGFRPLPGTNPNTSLIPLGENPLLVQGPFPGTIQLLDSNTVAPVDYDFYQLILEDGTVLFINQHTGLTQMVDTNGNSLTINNGGIIHSSGKSINFTRDAQGRITQITDPAGNSMTYTYDANGDLTSFSDREGNVTTFDYNSTHGLLTINDPRGIQPLRNEYDAEGRLIRQIDAFSKEINFTHDLNAQQETVFDRLGHATLYEYDARGNVLRVQDAEGNLTTRTYDARDNLLTETNALGKTVTYTYDDQDNRSSETDALGNKSVYTYNSRKQVLTAADPANGITTYTYDANGNQTAVKDALGHTTSATFSTNGLQLTSTDALNHTTSFEYDDSGNLIKQTDPLGNVSTYTYDTNGNRLNESQTRFINGATETLTTTFEYDKLGRQTKVTYPDSSTTGTIYNSIGKQSVTIDQLGRRTSYDYDDMGQLIRTTYPDATKEETEYDFEGRRVKSIDRAGRSTVYAYDSLGRLEKVTYADNSEITTIYDGIGQVAETKDALGNITRYEYDAAGRRARVIDALDHETAFGYDTRGNQISVKDAKGELTNYSYDANNRRIQVQFPDSTTQTTAYDDLGQVLSKRDQAGLLTQFEYDARGKLIKVIDALNGVTRYTYDEQGNQLSQTDANNHTTAYAYDLMGRRIRRTLPVGMSETYVYDLAGNLISRTDFRGKTTTVAYDVMNRMLSKTPDASLAEPAITFTYTSTGRRLTMTDASGITSYVYDSRDRLSSKATPQGTLTYTYDGQGNAKSVSSSNPNGVTVDYNYDVLNRLASVRDNRLAGATTSYAYDANGNLETTTYPNAVRTTYSYNSLNRLTNVNAAKGVTLANYVYTLGAAGNRLSVTEASTRKVVYAYDDLYRLKGESISNDPVATNNGAINYTYDAVGNRLSRTSTVGAVPTTNSTYDQNDRLASDTYDLNGNTTIADNNSYQYDFENRLTSLNGGAVWFVYDGDGNRVAKIISGVRTKPFLYGGKGNPVPVPKTNGAVTINYLVDTNNPTGHAQVVEELVESSVQRTYTYGLDLISQNQLIGGIWTPSFYGYDGHGSVRYLTNALGAITDTYTYDAFGNLIASTGTTPNDYLYAGEQLDGNLGFYYLRARWMNPSSGRFQTIDTFEGKATDPISLHKFLYAHNNPANKIDPSGRQAGLFEDQLEAVELQKGLLALGIFSTYLVLLHLQQSLPLSVSETLPRKPYDYIQIFYRGVAGYEATISVKTRNIDYEALLESQGEGHHLDFGPGYYMTQALRTANYFASDYENGRGGGPAVLKIEILHSVWDKRFRQRGVIEGAPISDAPGHSQTFVPPSLVRLFGHLARFSEIDYTPNK